MIVVDASAAVAALLNDGAARRLFGREQLHAPHLIDTEVTSGLRRAVARGRIAAADGRAALDVQIRLGLVRHATFGLSPRIWELRENVSAYDATYVALAEALGCDLVTADARLAGAPGIRCPVTVVPG